MRNLYIYQNARCNNKKNGGEKCLDDYILAKMIVRYITQKRSTYVYVTQY